jgi:hypothetical protein
MVPALRSGLERWVLHDPSDETGFLPWVALFLAGRELA